MLRYELRASDVGDVRFGLSPLCELGLSLRAIHEPSRYPLQLPWLRQTQAARAGLDHEALRALIDDRLWTPDFLNPRPVSPLTRLDDELAVLSRIRTTTFHRDLEAVHGSVPAIFAGDPRAAVRRVVAALRGLWDAAFAPYWPRMRAVLEADIAYRGRQIAQSGLGVMLNGISSTVRFDGRVISVALRDPVDRTRRTDGQGVTLVPTVFTARASAPVGDAAPLILYPARGQGAMWERQQVTTSAALVGIPGTCPRPAAHGARRTRLVDGARGPLRRDHVCRRAAPARAARGRPRLVDAIRPVGAVPAQRARQRARAAGAGRLSPARRQRVTASAPPSARSGRAAAAGSR